MASSGASSTQPFTDSAEVRRRVRGADSEAASTQPFTDSAEVRRRAGVVAPEHQNQPAADRDTKVNVSNQNILPVQTQAQAPPPLNLPIEELTKAFANASLATLPDARLVFACPYSPDSLDSVIIPLPVGVGGWDTVGVVQRTRDVDFAISLPFWIRSTVQPFPLVREQLRCRIYYNPVSDDCLLINDSDGHIDLARLVPPGGSKQRLARSQDHVVSPGVWRISIYEGEPRQQYLADLCVLRRQFSVDIAGPGAQAWPISSVKRPASGDDEAAAKRQRLEDDVSEILLAPTANRHRQSTTPGTGTVNKFSVVGADVLNQLGVADVPTGPGSPVTTLAQQTSWPGVMPLLRLGDGEVAIVRTTRPKNPDRNNILQLEAPDLQTTHANSPATYELRRVGGIANTASSSVFLTQHSELSNQIVTKVIKYESMTSQNLVSYAMKWQMEKDMLEKLRHRNIVSLKGFDGRLFAVYIERLPPSLHRGLNSPFQPSDASAVLHDVLSAFVYLESQKIAHNDIKPANITYSPQRGAVLTDFEMATVTTENNKEPGGTPWYVPPEFAQKRFEPNRGAPGDMWALGVTMLYVLGKITLPEKTVKPWRISHAQDKKGQPHQQMMGWVRLVLRAGRGLGSTDQVEGVVQKIVVEKRELRVRAGEALAMLGSAE
ncbi:kinase-like domain-containing protein [Cercophora scortea]|uniref:non-specific serine/threonine protein kinase n=1 Tax=Cercophora scortea TaxID=314031 RepID=A0AAE0M533_9PEZI|nr:kinase-like domain-containing protein [Cercophora scortea]